MRLPQIDIRQIRGQIDIRSERGGFDIRQKNAELRIETAQAKVDIKQGRVSVEADMGKTWDALNGGGTISFMNRLYNQFGQFVPQAIANKVREYDQIGDLTLGSDQIANVARQSLTETPPSLQVYGEASRLNVSFNVEVTKPEVNITPSKPQIDVALGGPEINYQRGEVRISMAQYPEVRITGPHIDILH